ncbi:hypothetical protein [Caldanaerobacter subterraneus]|uniref:Uncharacterized protein n=2 Tax=Caldanaerobacter subterraneus TaxID=911092 RepID=A0A4R2JIT3_9THEO|nr:hypothetical protein [Caldanaerobacter subterraneus]ERM90712.1 hypothetical protein O163_14440 [Caldanaerobacter subterraneus subsp. yonseiensis KB-1]NNG68119.1 hypothetical protein [Caldanaerobacter subterraneus]TCO58994.1 hypothetical protein EV203_12513 [Caldanaerobacter subterraneus]
MAQYNITIDSEILHYLCVKGAKNEKPAKFLEKDRGVKDGRKPGVAYP